MRLGSNRSGRRGVALVAVVVVGLSLVLLTLALLAVVRADVASLRHSSRDAQVRLAAASAVDLILARLGEQRSDVAAGRMVRLEDRFEIFEVDAERVAVARILETVPGAGGALPEAARIDVNRCDAATLEATGLFDASQAARIVRARELRPMGRYVHLSDLLADDPGLSPSFMYGPLEEISILSRLDTLDDAIDERIERRLDDELGVGRSRPVDVLTVHSFEPDVRRDGRPRHLPGDPIDVDETPSLAAILSAMSGSGSAVESEDADDEEDAEVGEAEADEASGDREVEPSADGIQARMRQAGIRLDALLADPDADAGAIVDAIGGDPSRWSVGLIDINTAPREVLRSLPEIDDLAADEIVSRRDALPDDRRFARTWPFEFGILDPQKHASVLDRITTRSFLWRMTVAVGTQAIDSEDDSLDDPRVWEILVDLGSVPPRLVELRDVTLFEFVARILDEDGSRLSGSPDLPDDRSASTDLDESGNEDTALFSAPPLFPDEPLFQDDPLFQEAPLFDGSSRPRADPGSPSDPLDGGGGVEDPMDPRSGRWRPATGTR